ncbi:MAG: deoxyribonuclease IV [Thermodesulfobacteriota bacterium]|nr:deoxyribonuclease IV [Thermodesulfobacteriota bacterium]
MPILGAHMSIAGGLHKAFGRMEQVKGKALQIFTKNQRQWITKEITEEEAGKFRCCWEESGKPPIAAHDSYLINLASDKPEINEKSISAMAHEIKRVKILGIPFLVMHPGSHTGAGVEKGLARVVKNLDHAINLAKAPEGVSILIETTAGQGTGLGADFSEIAYILDNSTHSNRLGVCFDTCHVFAAGYDIRTPETYEDTFSEFDRIIGLDRLKFFHLNDSKNELGSRVDRHEHIGKGSIGLPGFRLLLNDSRFADHPMVLETPKKNDPEDDRKNLAMLRKLIKIHRGLLK